MRVSVSYISDLHLDFHVPFDNNQLKWKFKTEQFIDKLMYTDFNASVLVIAGDISHFNCQSIWAIERFALVYKKVLVTYGNHDMYLVSKTQARKYSLDSMERILELRSLIMEIPNVYPLFFGGIAYVEGLVFSGMPMWYKVETDEEKDFFYNHSNDSSLIKSVNINDLHERNICAYNNSSEVDVMISHIPVIETDSHREYGKPCYFTEVDEIKAKHWIFGHTHEQVVIKENDCTFYSNAIGYPDQKNRLTIQSFEI